MTRRKTAFLIFAILFILLLTFILGANLWMHHIADHFFDRQEDFGNYSIVISTHTGRCFYQGYSWDGNEETKQITIPDTYKDYKVTELGGYYGRGLPMPFMITLPEQYNFVPEGKEYEDYESVYGFKPRTEDIAIPFTIENIRFELNIGKNLKKIKEVSGENYFPHFKEDGSLVFYHPVVSVNCSPDNPTFYAKNGKLYNRADDTLVKSLPYD